jgi:hypothetical protein
MRHAKELEGELARWRDRALEAEAALGRASGDIVRLRRLLRQAVERAEQGRPAGYEPVDEVVGHVDPAGVCAWCGRTYREGSWPASHGMCEVCEKKMEGEVR